jgi:hypothetical protein
MSGGGRIGFGVITVLWPAGLAALPREGELGLPDRSATTDAGVHRHGASPGIGARDGAGPTADA